MTTSHSRREFLIGSAGAATAVASQSPNIPVIDCHTHAGIGTALTAPWTTVADPSEILRRNQEAGIDKACIFPISHETFAAANREIAAIVKQYPGRFIGYPQRLQAGVHPLVRQSAYSLPQGD